MPKNQIVKSC